MQVVLASLFFLAQFGRLVAVVKEAEAHLAGILKDCLALQDVKGSEQQKRSR